MPKGSNTACWVYFIECGDAGPIKIGIATSVWSRLATLQSSSPYEMRCLVAVERPLAKFLEADLHAQFADSLIRGEWYERTDELIDLINRFRSGDRHLLSFHECSGAVYVDGHFTRFKVGRRRRALASAPLQEIVND